MKCQTPAHNRVRTHMKYIELDTALTTLREQRKQRASARTRPQLTIARKRVLVTHPSVFEVLQCHVHLHKRVVIRGCAFMIHGEEIRFAGAAPRSGGRQAVDEIAHKVGASRRYLGPASLRIARL